MKILHVFRTPVGGLFRHVRDLARGQSELGHQVGIICDATTGGSVAADLLDSVTPYCSLGIQRIEISRLPGLSDLSAIASTRKHAHKLGVDIIHGHGAKGGLYGRLAARSPGIPSVYTPHGGSLHYQWLAFPGFVFLASEWALAYVGTGMIFVCEFERQSFAKKIGLGGKPNTVVHNGLWPEEFKAVTPDKDAADVLYMGDMRHLKGVDVLLKALALVARKRKITACLVGDGPDSADFKKLAESLELGTSTAFPGRLPTAQALKRGRLLVLPSRAESFPYVVLEAAAGRVPMIASDVGGIPEILPAKNLCPPDNPEALARHIEMALAIPAAIAEDSKALSDSARTSFDAGAMARNVTEFYQRLLTTPAYMENRS
ncbi:MAG TPA: glycosyltransferase family 4 protein [Aestuariivirga sp.]|nr:glycosyltransferase family 4 protein [Aestuariivirga sp.]